MIDKRSYPRERYWHSDCFISFDHYKIDFITYLNVVEVLITEIDGILILETNIFKVNHICPGDKQDTLLYPTPATLLYFSLNLQPQPSIIHSLPYPTLPTTQYPTLHSPAYPTQSPIPYPSLHVLTIPCHPILPHPTLKLFLYIIHHTYPILLFYPTSSDCAVSIVLCNTQSCPALLILPSPPLPYSGMFKSRVTVFVSEAD